MAHSPLVVLAQCRVAIKVDELLLIIGAQGKWQIRWGSGSVIFHL